ncbi:UNVERIFIED_CONTAM: serpin family protein, partial [Prevotella sp. 15_C9]
LFYAENKDFKAVDLPYGNGSYRMLVLLPNEGKNIQEMMKGLDEEKLNQISQNMENCMVNLKLPKFTIEQELPLNAI